MRQSPPMTSTDQQVRSAGPGVTERDVPATEKEEREVASEMDLKVDLCQTFSCRSYDLRKIGWRYDSGSLSSGRPETDVDTSSLRHGKLLWNKLLH